MSMHSYGLSWIDEKLLFEVTLKKFQSFLSSNSKSINTLNGVFDPFTMMVHEFCMKRTMQSALYFEIDRQLNKSISNAIGKWHQEVLGLAPNWVNKGDRKGYDIETIEGYTLPGWDKPVIAEVKNRYNTIKGADEKHVWDVLESFVRAKDAVAYLIQIIPKDPVRYDKPWKPSGRQEKEYVRVCDGATAYEFVFGYKNALFELCNAFPQILDGIMRYFDFSTRNIDNELVRELSKKVFPK